MSNYILFAGPKIAFSELLPVQDNLEQLYKDWVPEEEKRRIEGYGPEDPFSRLQKVWWGLTQYYQALRPLQNGCALINNYKMEDASAHHYYYTFCNRTLHFNDRETALREKDAFWDSLNTVSTSAFWKIYKEDIRFCLSLINPDKSTYHWCPSVYLIDVKNGFEEI